MTMGWGSGRQRQGARGRPKRGLLSRLLGGAGSRGDAANPSRIRQRSTLAPREEARRKALIASREEARRKMGRHSPGARRKEREPAARRKGEAGGGPGILGRLWGKMWRRGAQEPGAVVEPAAAADPRGAAPPWEREPDPGGEGIWELPPGWDDLAPEPVPAGVIGPADGDGTGRRRGRSGKKGAEGSGAPGEKADSRNPKRRWRWLGGGRKADHPTAAAAEEPAIEPEGGQDARPPREPLFTWGARRGQRGGRLTREGAGPLLEGDGEQPRPSRAPREGRGGGKENRPRRAPPRAPARTDRFGRPQGRLELVVGMFMLGFTMLALRAVDLTTLQGGDLKERAAEQHRANVEIPAYRGRLLDRYGRTLAISLPVKSLSVDRARVGDPVKLARRLAPILGMEVKALTSRIQDAPPQSFPVIKRKLPPGMSEQVEALDDPALFFTPEVERVYPMGEVTGHVLGFVDVDGKGLEGLEKSFDEHLQGQPGVRLVTRDRLGRLMPESRIVRPARPGTDLILTIDATIQYIAYKALMKGVNRTGARAGSVVVMDPASGEILALVNQPGFNPNDLRHSKAEGRRNRALTDEYEPGSTFKTFVVAAALNEGLITPQTTFDCENGRFYVRDRVVRDHHPYGRLTVQEVVQKSSNVCSAKIGLMTGNTVQEAYISGFGFGQPTGIELTYEATGKIPDIFHYRDVGLANRSFGQGITVTPVQMAAAMSAAVNGGMYHQPRLVAGQVIKGMRYQRVEPEPEQVIRPEVSTQIRRILQTVTEPGGTGTQARVAGYAVGGKTGTAQKAGVGGYVDGKYFASFVGFAPVESPRLVVMVGIDEPPGEHFGGQVAAPVFKEIVEESLPLLPVLPEVPLVAELPPLRETLVAGNREDHPLKETLTAMMRKGLVPRLHGLGQVVAQERVGGGGVRLVLQ